jgi:hypothetical protein
MWNMNRWDEQQATRWAKTNKDDTIWKGGGKRLSLTRGWGQDGHIHEYVNSYFYTSMYKMYMVLIHMKRKDWDVTSHLYNSLIVLDYLSLYSLYNSLFMLDYLFSRTDNLFPCLIVFFRQVKNKSWLSWVYSWIQHRSEKVSTRIIW